MFVVGPIESWNDSPKVGISNLQKIGRKIQNGKMNASRHHHKIHPNAIPFFPSHNATHFLGIKFLKKQTQSVWIDIVY